MIEVTSNIPEDMINQGGSRYDKPGREPVITSLEKQKAVFISSRAEGPGREILQCPPVCPSVTFSFRTETRKCIDVFSWKTYVHHVMGVHSFFILMESCLNLLNIDQNKILWIFVSIFHVSSRFMQKFVYI